MARDPYQVLGVDRSDDLSHIRRAYLAAMRVNHPDVRPGDPRAEQRTRELNHAWEEVRASHQDVGRPSMTPPSTRPRSPSAAYSSDRRAFRTAFTTATLRVALLLVVCGLLLLLLALGR